MRNHSNLIKGLRTSILARGTFRIEHEIDGICIRIVMDQHTEITVLKDHNHATYLKFKKVKITVANGQESVSYTGTWRPSITSISIGIGRTNNDTWDNVVRRLKKQSSLRWVESLLAGTAKRKMVYDQGYTEKEVMSFFLSHAPFIKYANDIVSSLIKNYSLHDTYPLRVSHIDMIFLKYIFGLGVPGIECYEDSEGILFMYRHPKQYCDVMQSFRKADVGYIACPPRDKQVFIKRYELVKQLSQPATNP